MKNNIEKQISPLRQLSVFKSMKEGYPIFLGYQIKKEPTFLFSISLGYGQTESDIESVCNEIKKMEGAIVNLNLADSLQRYHFICLFLIICCANKVNELSEEFKKEIISSFINSIFGDRSFFNVEILTGIYDEVNLLISKTENLDKSEISKNFQDLIKDHNEFQMFNQGGFPEDSCFKFFENSAEKIIVMLRNLWFQRNEKSIRNFNKIFTWNQQLKNLDKFQESRATLRAFLYDENGKEEGKVFEKKIRTLKKNFLKKYKTLLNPLSRQTKTKVSDFFPEEAISALIEVYILEEGGFILSKLKDEDICSIENYEVYLSENLPIFMQFLRDYSQSSKLEYLGIDPKKIGELSIEEKEESQAVFGVCVNGVFKPIATVSLEDIEKLERIKSQLLDFIQKSDFGYRC